MLDRNRRIKLKPEKFQHSTEQFDLIITCEERVYDQVIDCNESLLTGILNFAGPPCGSGYLIVIFILLLFLIVADFNSKSPIDNTPVHIINVDIQDNQEEATIGAFFIWELVQLVGI